MLFRWALLIWFVAEEGACFNPTFVRSPVLSRPVRRLASSSEDEENPYQDDNYPELEFVNYSDPEYSVDQGDEYFGSSGDETEMAIEEMREDRRHRNDEFQFETYFESVLKKGTEYKGEWSIYQTSTFLDHIEDTVVPQIVQVKQPMMVASSAERFEVKSSSSQVAIDQARIRHKEVLISNDGDDLDPKLCSIQEDVISNHYSPDQLAAKDFRGPQGIMCVGQAYTICQAIPFLKEAEEGPYSEMRTEIGIWDDDLRLRIKFDYRVKKEDEQVFLRDASKSIPPALHLKSLIVCREAKGRLPKNSSRQVELVTEEELMESELLFGIPGAQNGLYDPPLVGSDEQAEQYLSMDLDGGATILFPYRMDQDPDAFSGNGWVTSLDWSPSSQRFQVDRKVKGGSEILGLRTLELSEVQKANAETYRPRDGGANMRQ